MKSNTALPLDTLDALQQAILDKLAQVLLPLGKVAVALSGGVDSALLAVAAARVLGPANVLAITVDAPMVPGADHAAAVQAARQAGVRHLILEVPVSILDEPVFRENPPDRCYSCKKLIFGRIRAAAEAEGYANVADGTNADDLLEYRPGLKAVQEMCIISPLAQAGISKNSIRLLAAALCPDFAAKPAMACLATRIPHGTPVTQAAMKRIDQAEQALRASGFPQIRVRDHQGLARVEISGEMLENGLEYSTIQLIRKILHEAGFRYAALDLDGYRTGSLQAAGEDENHADQS